VGGQTTVDEKAYPLPKPQRRQPDSGLAMPFLGSGNLSLLNADLTASVAQLIDSVRFDAATESVAQLTLVSHDPELALAKSKLADIGCDGEVAVRGADVSLWDISTVDVEAAECAGDDRGPVDAGEASAPPGEGPQRTQGDPVGVGAAGR
jgi:hypothetical protein